MTTNLFKVSFCGELQIGNELIQHMHWASCRASLNSQIESTKIWTLTGPLPSGLLLKRHQTAAGGRSPLQPCQSWKVLQLVPGNRWCCFLKRLIGVHFGKRCELHLANPRLPTAIPCRQPTGPRAPNTWQRSRWSHLCSFTAGGLLLEQGHAKQKLARDEAELSLCLGCARG